MASVENLEQKFLQQLQQTESFAIALTGEWGIGKTHFWKSFYNENRGKFKKPIYSYVSVFGIESLEALKYEIAIQSQRNSTPNFLNRISLKLQSLLKVFLEKIKIDDVKNSGVVISSSKNTLSVLGSIVVKNSVICIDDLERKSDKLDMKDLMGFINQLKTEKNCQVIVILHQDKINEQNTEFQEYKEKVFDDVFYLTDNFSIIKEMIKNHEMIDIYQEFYDKLKVKNKNLRFYQKVDKDFQNIMSLGHDFSYKSKEYILKNLLMIRFAEYFSPKILSIDINDNDSLDQKSEHITFNLKLLKDISMHSNRKIDVYKKDISRYSKDFFKFYEIEDWMKIIIDYLMNYNLDHNDDTLKDIITKNHSFECIFYYNRFKSDFENLEFNEINFNNFYNSSIKSIPYLSLRTLSNYYQYISMFSKDKANQLKELSQNFIIDEITKSDKKLSLEYFELTDSHKENIFYEFTIEQLNILNENKEVFSYLDYFLHGKGKNSEDDIKNKLNNINKNDLKEIIWVEKIPFHSTRRSFLKSIINNRLLSKEKQEQVRQWIVELLQEKVQENPDSKIPIEYWLKQTENLTKFD
ncbi:P-loop NTPase fold protein [Moraxella sp. ZY210820]|uniref:P-loop NTPase fold protein n=1 Tax=unclassified Moraxella TaxID=2685852 RepID=UPI0027308A5D|nr:P-loop NTPase fold protein [Moraxella sp. ZY210820]WLF84891.1 KAP family NTPase [Moraxella sp. ZY210820]